jgi:ubiquinone/menaquinone biosynthesis C-methylase UbiE
MLKVAKLNCSRFDNVGLVVSDGLELPFPDQAFDIITTRLAEYSPREAYRVFKEGGFFFEYSLGPQADKEILEFFPERIETESFFFPNNPRKWKKEVSEPIEKAGFVISDVQDFKENDYYESEEELMDVIEMVPLVKDFDRNKDRKLVKRLAEKYRKKRGIRITWHYYVLVAKRQ